MALPLYFLLETASGFSLFQKEEGEEIALLEKEVQKSLQDVSRFRKLVKLIGFSPFTSADESVENCVKVCKDGELTETLKAFLLQYFPEGKKRKLQLGVADPALGKSIQDGLSIPCVANETVNEYFRMLRQHASKLLPHMDSGALQQAQLGLAHGFSRTLVQENAHRSSNMIIQCICILDQMDKDINQFAMRVKEWYGWHFPELQKEVSDIVKYCKLVLLIRDKSTLTDDKLKKVNKITEDEDQATRIIKLAKHSMGMAFVDADLDNITVFAQRVLNLANFRKELYDYLTDKMNLVAPNVAALIGEQVGARLISQAGSLTNLAKCPASTLQILGAEKALFRALKARGPTPKYGLIFHSSFIARAPQQYKGRISRYLATKCSIAARVDCFMDKPNRVIGESLAQMVENRLLTVDSTEPQAVANEDAIVEAYNKYLQSVKKRKKAKEAAAEEAVEEEPPAKKSRKKAAAAEVMEEEDEATLKQRRKEEKKRRKQQAANEE